MSECSTNMLFQQLEPTGELNANFTRSYHYQAGSCMTYARPNQLCKPTIDCGCYNFLRTQKK